MSVLTIKAGLLKDSIRETTSFIIVVRYVEIN